MIEKSQILISTQRALLFNVLKSTRFIFVNYNKIDRIDLIIISDRKLTQKEKDTYYAVSSEIDGDFEGINGSDVNFIESNLEFSILNCEKYGTLVFARYETLS